MMGSVVELKGNSGGNFANFMGVPGVLFIDDEPEVLASLRRVFRQVKDITVFTTSDPEEALELIRYEQIYLIITDQNMPGIMGTELLRRVKEIAPHIKLGILTAYADLQLVQESVNDIRVSYLFTKPYDNRELIGKVLTAVQDVDRAIRDQSEQLRTRKRNDELESLNQDLIKLSMERKKLTSDIEHGYKALLKIGKLLGKEKDEDTLLRLILHTAREMTGADAGSLYILEENPETGSQFMKIKYSYTYSKELPYEEEVLPVSTSSIAGYVFLKGKVLNIPDVRDMPATVPFSFNPSFDEKYDYHTRSMLLLPMHDQNDRVIGVIQLINRKMDVEPTNDGDSGSKERTLSSKADFDRYVLPFKEDSLPFMEALAGQAGITIQRNRLLYQIEGLFEGFVKSSVEAIESRDSATVGHSLRVAGHCLKMAESINNTEEGPFAELRFDRNRMKRLEYAAMLHDFGKLFIDPKVLLKEKKILPQEMQQIEQKFAYAYRYQELIYTQQTLQLIRSENNGSLKRLLRDIEEEKTYRLKEISSIASEVKALNEPSVESGSVVRRVEELRRRLSEIEVRDLHGNRCEVVSEAQLAALAVERGSLTEDERREINNHVNYTHDFIARMPWPEQFQDIPMITLRHHEKLNGEGYPYGVEEEDIPLDARMIAVADVYDALTASDRPYKKAVSRETAVLILQMEASKKSLDQDVVNLFIRTCL